MALHPVYRHWTSHMRALGVIDGDFIPAALTGHIPPEFGELNELRILNIRWQSLTGEIPPELGNLPKLESLHLSGNRFTGCIPLTLQHVESKDLAHTDLRYCKQ